MHSGVVSGVDLAGKDLAGKDAAAKADGVNHEQPRGGSTTKPGVAQRTPGPLIENAP